MLPGVALCCPSGRMRTKTFRFIQYLAHLTKFVCLLSFFRQLLFSGLGVLSFFGIGWVLLRVYVTAHPFFLLVVLSARKKAG